MVTCCVRSMWVVCGWTCAPPPTVVMSSTLTSNRPTVADLDSTVVYVVYLGTLRTVSLNQTAGLPQVTSALKKHHPATLHDTYIPFRYSSQKARRDFSASSPEPVLAKSPKGFKVTAVSSASCLSPDMPYEPAASDPSKRRTFSSPPDRRSARAVRRDSAIPSGRGSHGAPRGRAGPRPGG